MLSSYIQINFLSPTPQVPGGCKATERPATHATELKLTTWATELGQKQHIKGNGKGQLTMTSALPCVMVACPHRQIEQRRG
ncbi:hypothetical protein EMCG_07381 [[Emmonsia] crescens]|uniref:Uncharacterized protein n=1 Tax=[Emmonsia] crescens TaxID=73230 RepID=A0A0G2I8W7_9EURO|nr:hypothetical protein EMCG_07381 [Emmonsia crescens UAMH 3008]